MIEYECEKFQTENHQQSSATITRFEEGREGMRKRLRGGGGGEGKVEGGREGGKERWVRT